MSLLDAEIQSLFGDVFGVIYLDGSLIPTGYTDDGQGGLIPNSPSAIPIKVQIDACTERQKLEAGYSARDVRLLVLQSGLDERITTNHNIVAKGVTYTLGPTITEDPASSYFEIRGTPS
jgi:hypothetical protein